MKGTPLNEEQTKWALIKPMLEIWGYDTSDPSEVRPEYIADIYAEKKGEKVDFALLKDSIPQVIIECKPLNEQLPKHDAQLKRYFQCTEARIAILTNGVSYRFFSDLEKTNIMDERPFLEVGLQNLTAESTRQMSAFQKKTFDEKAIIAAAEEAIKRKIIEEYLRMSVINPSDDFLNFVLGKVLGGKGKRLVSTVKSAYTPLVKEIWEQLLTGIQTKDMFQSDNTRRATCSNLAIESVRIEKTERSLRAEEEDVVNVVLDIICSELPLSEVVIFPRKHYCAVSYKGKNKRIAAISCHKIKSGISIGVPSGKDIFHEITNADDIKQYANELVTIARHYAR